MVPDDVAKENADESSNRRTSVDREIEAAKDALLRLRERNGHLQARIGTLENRLKRVTVLALLFLVGILGMVVFLLQRQSPNFQQEIARLQASLLPLQAKVTELEHARLNTESEATSQKRTEPPPEASLSKIDPDMLAAALKNAIHVDEAGNVGIGTATPKAKLEVVGNLLGAARGPNNAMLRIATGSTDPKKTNWVQYTDGGVYVDVNTASAKFSSVPHYFTSLGGHTNSWLAQGTTSIYQPTATGFRIHVSYPDLTAAQARDWGWYVNWIAVGE